MSKEQQDAVLAVLRAAAESELELEEARRRLCEVHDFAPKAVFQVLQGSSPPYKGWIGASDIHLWLGAQHHAVSGTSIEDISAAIYLRTGSREVWYEDFIRLMLPNTKSGSWLKELALTRGNEVQIGHLAKDRLPPEVAFRVCQVFQIEFDLGSRLRFHRQRLSDLAVRPDAVFRFLDAEQGYCAGMGGLLSASAVRSSLCTGSGYLSFSPQQCDALLQRVNPSGACLFSVEALTRHLYGTSKMPAEALARATPSLLIDSSPLSPRTGRVGFASHIYDSPGIHTGFISSPIHMASPLNSASPVRAFIDHSPVILPPSTDIPGLGSLSPTSPLTPLPTHIFPSARPSRHHGPGINSKALSSSHIFESPKSPAAGFSYKRAMSPLASKVPAEQSPRARSLSPHRALTPSRGARFAMTPSYASAYSPASARSPNLQSPRTSSRAYSPNASRRHIDSRNAEDAFRTSSALTPSPYTPRSGLSPASAVAPLSPRATMTAPALAKPGIGMSFHPLSFPTAKEEQALRQVLRTMARQAHFDARMEDAKAMLPSTCSVEDVFDELDSFRMGHLGLSDIRRFLGCHGSALSYASFGALVHEAHLRHRVHDQAGWSLAAAASSALMPEYLTFRDLATLLLPAGSNLLEALLEAQTDNEARSVLYLLKNSEPCPGCGFRAQRSADVAGCPSVTCPACRTQFQCFNVVSDRPGPKLPLTAACRHQLHRLLTVALEAADELERDRRDLALVLSKEVCGLCDMFVAISGMRDRLGFYQTDLRRAFVVQGLPVPHGLEMDLLWHRYAPRRADMVNFTNFRGQLQPRP